MDPTNVSIEELPNEVLLEITKRLSGAILFEELPHVSKRFKALGKATKPLFSVENDGVVEGNIQKVHTLSKEKNLYFQKISISRLKSRADLEKLADLVKNQPGLKNIQLTGECVALRSQSDAVLEGRKLKDAILDLKYLTSLIQRGIEITTRSHKEWVGQLKYPYKRQSLSTVPWTKIELKKLLALNKNLTSILLPKITVDAFNFLMEDPAAEEWRNFVCCFVISGLHRTQPEAEISWKNLSNLKELNSLQAGELDEDFWRALPKLKHLNNLVLELTSTSLEKIVHFVKEEQIQLKKLTLCCHESIDWKKVPMDVSHKLLEAFQVERLVLECKIGNPIDIGDLVSIFSHWTLKELIISVYHTEDRNLDMESVQKLEQPSLPHLEVLIFSTYVPDSASDIDYHENETLFQPVLQRLFHGTSGQTVAFEHVTTEGGILQWWSNKEWDDLVNGFRNLGLPSPSPSTKFFPSWGKKYPIVSRMNENDIIVLLAVLGMGLLAVANAMLCLGFRNSYG